MNTRRAGLVILIVMASLGWAGPGYAAVTNAYESAATLYYVADPGEVNDIVINLTADGYTLDDAVPISTGLNCKHPGADLTYVVCQARGISTVWVETYDGDDTIDHWSNTYFVGRGGDGNDIMWGGLGTDSLWGEAGNDYVNGWSGDDWISGGTGTDQLYGGTGSADTVSYTDSPGPVAVDLDGVADDGGPGENDTIGPDFEILNGSQFNDWLAGNAASNSIYGLAGNDYLYGFGGNDYLYGDGFSDYAIGADYLSGGTGTDYVSYSDHTAAQPVVADIDGVSGDDGAAGEGDTIATDVENLDGSPGADWIVGSSGPNQMGGGAGNDIVMGMGGNDTVSGNDGDDHVYGGDGDDLVTGDAGNDFLYGNNNSDTLNGGIGTDTCDYGPGGTYATFCEA